MMKMNWNTAMKVIIWSGLFTIYFIMAHYSEPIKNALISAVYNTLSLFLIYKITVGYLFPNYYGNQRRYLLLSFAVILVLTALFLFINKSFIPRTRGEGYKSPPLFFLYFWNLIATSFTFFIATSVSLMEHTIRLHENEKLLTKEKLETELKLLKAQINPHFIFNALNNIYSLTYMQSKKAPESVLKLSEMLRYVFYDCNKDRVPLSAEVQYIKNFIAFQQIKSEFAQNISLKTEINGANLEIAPMLFIPFIENAFKYSRIEENESAFINIKIIHQDSKLHFIIKNSFPENNKPLPGSGMGIKNVKYRLDIIYPKKYELVINEGGGLFNIDLRLDV